jgi:tetratricopeptide (TPR) repeat protein
MSGAGKVFTGPLREGVEALEQTIPLMEKRRDFIGAAFSRGWLAIGYATLGDFERAEAATRSAVAEAAEDGDLIAQLDAQISVAMLHSARGDLEAAAPLAMDCVQKAEETGASACAMVSSFILGDVYQRQQRLHDASEALRLGIALAPGSGPGIWGTTLRVWLRSTDERLGNPASEPDWDEALTTAREHQDRLSEAAIRWKRAESAIALGRPGDAPTDFEVSSRIYETEGARPNLARVLRSWGLALIDAGQADEAEAILRRSLAVMDAIGLEREASELRDRIASRA